MIYESDDKPRKGEVKVWTVAVGNLPRNNKELKKSKEALEIIKRLHGLVGLYPIWPDGTLLLFRTLNDAKRAKNKLDSYHILTGYNICEVFIEVKYIHDKEKETAISQG